MQDGTQKLIPGTKWLNLTKNIWPEMVKNGPRSNGTPISTGQVTSGRVHNSMQMCPLQTRNWRKCAPSNFWDSSQISFILRTFVANLALWIKRFFGRHFWPKFGGGGHKKYFNGPGRHRSWVLSKWKHRWYVAIQWGFSVGIFRKKRWHTSPSCQLHSAPELTLAHDQHMTTVVIFQ